MSNRLSATMTQGKGLCGTMCEEASYMCMERLLTFGLIRVTIADAVYINAVAIHLSSKILFLVVVERGSGRPDFSGILVDGIALICNIGFLREPWTSIHRWKPGLDVVYNTSAHILLARSQ